jgi:uncharacterized protein YjbI with pentapeptide repeats
MKKPYTVVLVVIALLTSISYAAADGPVGTDCTNPPHLVPFADLVNCDLSGRFMEGVDLHHANLTGANLENADLFTSNLVAATFDNANLRNANLDDAYAPGGSFINADLRGANLYFATLSDANLSGANLSNSWLGIHTFAGSNLQNANLSGSTISGDLRNTDLRGADLSFTALGYVSFNNADFRDATLLGAERSVGVNFSGVIWGNTTCPDGSTSDAADGDNFTCEGNFPENIPPTITLTSPTDGSSVPFGAPITISGDAADPDGSVSRVELYGDGEFLAYVFDPFTFDWTNVPAGTHEVYAIAFDDNGVFAGEQASTQSETVTVIVKAPPNNQPPAVTITKPRNNQTVYRFWGTDFNVTASDPDGVITKVEFYAGSTLLNTDTAAPFNYYWRPAANGTQTLTAKAYDNGGATTTSAPVTMRVR